MDERGLSDLISTASSILNSQSHHSSSSNTQQQPPAAGHGHAPPAAAAAATAASHGHKPSYSEVMASAQVVMNAAKAKLHKSEAGSGDDIDMGKLAEATGNLIGAASHYGKLNESSYGKYAQKAEDYLHSYGGKHGKTKPSGGSDYPVNDHANYPANYDHGKHSSSSDVPPQGYPSAHHASEAQHGYGSAAASQAHQQGYAASQAYQGYAPSAPPQAHQSSQSVEGYPPAGYPPAGYPPAGYPTADHGESRPGRWS